MDTLDLDLARLRTCIGQELDFDGHHCRIIEILEDGPALVLACESAAAVIQPDQYGDANRRVTLTRTVPVLSSDQLQFHPEFLRLNLTGLKD
ncbi:MAG: hypothetical protein ABR553_08865 [Gammaproteobacteria bacterium]